VRFIVGACVFKFKEFTKFVLLAAETCFNHTRKQLKMEMQRNNSASNLRVNTTTTTTMNTVETTSAQHDIELLEGYRIIHQLHDSRRSRVYRAICEQTKQTVVREIFHHHILELHVLILL
jgi:hypothetical protein